MLIDELTNEILEDEYFQNLFVKAEIINANDFFACNQGVISFSEKDFIDLVRFADILSHSESPEARNKAYKIISLLIDKFGNNNDFIFSSSAILAKLGNFPALKFLQDNYEKIGRLPLERELEKRFKIETQKTSDGKNIFTDSQYKIRNNIDNYDFFSFSGPTSIGKSFILRDFIKDILDSGKNNNLTIVVLVPTRALISQVVCDLRNDINNKNVNIASNPAPSLYASNKYKSHIYIFTPERLLSYIGNNNVSVNYLFVDEAQKIVSENDPRSSLYYHSIFETLKRFSAKIIFASPNIPNPGIFLKLFGKDERGAIAINDQTVSQNKYFIDFIKSEAYLFSDLGKKESIKDFKFIKPNKLIFDLGQHVNNIIYCNGISETISRAREFSEGLEEINDPAIQDFITFASEYVHKDYYLIDCLKRGVAFHHGKMPQKIRRGIENLFSDKNSPLRYVFCTSTLLEGLNLPAKNIFVFNDNHGGHHFKKIDFENLIGRAGRLTKEFSGNVVCIKDSQDRWQDEGNLLIKEKLANTVSFITNENARSNKEFINIGKVLTNKKTSSALRVGEKENINNYASIILLHSINNEDSLLKSAYFKKNKNAAKEIEFAQELNHVPVDVIKLSPTIKLIYQNKALDYIRNNKKNAILSLDINSKESILSTLQLLYNLYSWDTEESRGKGCLIPASLVKSGYGMNRLGYWSMLLKNWIKSEPLRRLIIFSMGYHFERGYIYFYDDGKLIREDFTGNKKQINVIINQVMDDIENGLRFKIGKYFYNYYLLLREVLGNDSAGPDWSEFIEYGTMSRKVIELQNLGLSRGAAKYLIVNHEDKFTFNNNEQLVEVNNQKIMDSIKKNNEYYSEIKEICE